MPDFLLGLGWHWLCLCNPWSHRGCQDGAETSQQGGWNGSTAIIPDRQELTGLPSHFLRGFVRDSSLLLETLMGFDGNITGKKTSAEAEVTWKGFLVAAVVVVLQTCAFVGNKSMTAGTLHHEKLSGFSCGSPMGFPRSVILTVLCQYAEFPFLP